MNYVSYVTNFGNVFCILLEILINPLSHIIILAKYKVSILLEVLHCHWGR